MKWKQPQDELQGKYFAHGDFYGYLLFIIIDIGFPFMVVTYFPF